MRNRIAFCAVLAALTANSAEIQLLPAGEFRAIDGRPEKVAAWRIDAAIAEKLRAEIAARANPLVIDYEHQTLRSIDNGQPAPAAGWLKSVEWREGVGLFAKVEWTPRAKELIAAGEYRFISPMFQFDKTGAVTRLMPPALVNYPALDGMEAVKLSALAERYADPDNHQETTMNPLLVAILAALGMKEDTKPEDATAAIVALKAKAGETDTLKTKNGELETSVAALKAGTPDPAKYVPIATVNALQTEVAALTAKVNGRQVEEIVDGAIKAGKLLPAMKDWATELGKKDVAQLQAYVDKSPAIAALAGSQTQGKKPGEGGQGELTEDQLAICSQLGLKPEDYKKQLAAAA